MSVYTVKSGDTIYDVAFNVAGSLAGVDPILEKNTPSDYPMLGISQLRKGIITDTGGYSTVNSEVGIQGAKSIEIFFKTPDYPEQHNNVLLSDNTTNTDSIAISINGGNTTITVNSVTVLNAPLIPSEVYHLIIECTDDSAWVWVNGVKSDVVSITPNTNSNGISLGAFASNENLKADIYFVRIFNEAISDVDAVNLWNNGAPFDIHLDIASLVSEYLPPNAFPFGWLDSAGNGHERLEAIGSPQTIIGVAILPTTNSMESYTPELYIDQILDTTGIVINNIQAIDGNTFNSTFLNREIVVNEARYLENILDKEAIATWSIFLDEAGNPIITEDNQQIELLTWQR